MEDAKANAQLNGEFKRPASVPLLSRLILMSCLALQELQTLSLCAVKQKTSLSMCLRICHGKQKSLELWTPLEPDCVSKTHNDYFQ